MTSVRMGIGIQSSSDSASPISRLLPFNDYFSGIVYNFTPCIWSFCTSFSFEWPELVTALGLKLTTTSGRNQITYREFLLQELTLTK